MTATIQTLPATAAPLADLGPGHRDGQPRPVHVDTGVRSTSATRTRPGSAAATRTPTACSASTSPRAPTSPSTTPPRSTPPPTASTADPAKPSTGEHHLRKTQRAPCCVDRLRPPYGTVHKPTFSSGRGGELNHSTHASYLRRYANAQVTTVVASSRTPFRAVVRQPVMPRGITVDLDRCPYRGVTLRRTVRGWVEARSPSRRLFAPALIASSTSPSVTSSSWVRYSIRLRRRRSDPKTAKASRLCGDGRLTRAAVLTMSYARMLRYLGSVQPTGVRGKPDGVISASRGLQIGS